ncbi:MAG TPA: hypothetical protein VKB93_27190 [Thermoanaerobaculia bacterium]|nr:hypothetical protein [Thermoanaerobaculia bacterium]
MSEKKADDIAVGHPENEAPTHQEHDLKRPLYPPVLSPWGSMFPSAPPRGYGDISYDPTQKATPDPHLQDELTPLDVQALALLPSIFPSRR